MLFVMADATCDLSFHFRIALICWAHFNQRFMHTVEIDVKVASRVTLAVANMYSKIELHLPVYARQL